MPTRRTIAGIGAFLIVATVAPGQRATYLSGLPGQDGPGAAAHSSALQGLGQGVLAEPGPAGTPIDISEAAGTLVDPTAFLYLSQEYVFNLLVLASQLNAPGIEYDPDAVPRRQTTTRRSPRARRNDNAVRASRREGSAARGSAAVMMVRDSAGGETEEDRQQEQPPHSGWLAAVSAPGNEDLARLLELVRDLPEWQRVGRFPLQTTEKQRIDKAIAGVYALALNVGVLQTRSQPADAYAPISPSGTAPAAAPPVDPQAMGEWYSFYQQMIAWERYVNEEILRLRATENTNRYDLDTALAPQDLYLVPQPPDAPLPIIHFDGKETDVGAYLSVVRPASAGAALDQMRRTMETWAEKRAREDSEESRRILARLDARKQRRFEYRRWLDDAATEIRDLAEAYRRRLDGDRITVDGIDVLIHDTPVPYVPRDAISVVTERLTPYDLLDPSGTLRQPSERTPD